ncbi:acyl-CoA dehydrogenase family protein [Glycomyces tritici]|uniref:Dibenzothiophene monooxygenase n=1 Tax=Glycomyces tritici TaxID=2665176 RepID=A0ABT7YSR0_9ACTN|nr:acyl-CoA dehydrogenase family protein [Glycomyces tritici]MDN3241674.1 acyl-CoA dehydrogenase family protein [Glycomyces tritici]
MTTSEHPADGPNGGARALALARELAPKFAERAAVHDEHGRFPEADFADLRAAGLFGLMVPERLGGFGASFAEYARVASALARGAGSTALVFNMHASVTGALAQTPDDLVRLLGAPKSSFEARDKALEAAAGGALYGVAMSERGSGSRLSQTSTAYRRTDSGYRIIGSKAFVSGAGHVDAYLVTAREADAEEPQVSYFLVPAGEGIRVEETWDSLGMRATGSQDVHFDLEVGPEALLGGVEGLTLMIAEAMPQWLVASYSAVYAGVARAAVDAAAEHLRRRGLGRLPAARARLGRADTMVAAAELVVAETAARIDSAPGDPVTNQWVWRAKLTAGDTAVQVASSLLEAAGASASRRGHTLERLYRDARCGALQPATSDVCADWLGVAALGEDPDHDAEVPRW